LVWDYWIGTDIGKTKCLCCKNIDILQGSFECGHIIAHSNKGDLSVMNLKPICKTCNSSMGSQNMDEFMKKWNFKITKPIKLIVNDHKFTSTGFITNILEKKYLNDNDNEEHKCEICDRIYNCDYYLCHHQQYSICGMIIYENKILQNKKEFEKTLQSSFFKDKNLHYEKYKKFEIYKKCLIKQLSNVDVELSERDGNDDKFTEEYIFLKQKRQMIINQLNIFDNMV
jgi:hypothetical protein